MTLHLGKGHSFATALVSFLASVVVPAVVLALASLALPAVTSPAGAATPLTVSQAVGQQTGATQTVRGYVVGQPALQPVVDGQAGRCHGRVVGVLLPPGHDRATATRSSTTPSGPPRSGTDRRSRVTGYPVTALLTGRDLYL